MRFFKSFIVQLIAEVLALAVAGVLFGFLIVFILERI